MGMSPQMPHRLNKLSASDCHAVLKKKKNLSYIPHIPGNLSAQFHTKAAGLEVLCSCIKHW